MHYSIVDDMQQHKCTYISISAKFTLEEQLIIIELDDSYGKICNCIMG